MIEPPFDCRTSAFEELPFFDVDLLIAIKSLLDSPFIFKLGTRRANAVPEEAFALIVIHALHHLIHGVDLTRPHDRHFRLARTQNPMAADGPPKAELFQEALGEGTDLARVLGRWHST